MANEANLTVEMQRNGFPSRFWARVQRGPGCWRWLGVPNQGGYGFVKYGGATLSVHRVAFALTQGAIPEGLCVCHHCDNPICVRPDHLFLGTHTDNMRDMAEKGRARSVKKEWTHCPQGHALTDENRSPSADGRRRCLKCSKARNQEWYKKNRALDTMRRRERRNARRAMCQK